MIEQRVPPQAIESEMVVLGSSLLNTEASELASEAMTPESFYKPAHNVIFSAIRDLTRDSERVDIITVMDRLRKKETLDQAGGVSYLNNLTDIMPVVSGLNTHIKAVTHAHGLRTVIDTARSVTEQCYQGGMDEDQAVQLEKIVFDAFGDTMKGSGFVHIGDIAMECFKTIEKLSTGEIKSLGLPTGYFNLDRLTLGLQPSDMIVLAGRPSMGKTALAMNIVENVTANGGKVGVVSLEMDTNSLVMRLISSIARVDSYRLRSGKIQDCHWPKLTKAVGKLSAMDIYIDDASALNPFEIRSRGRRLKMKHDVDLIVIDYLQLSKTESRSEQEEISIVSREMKAMAKELKIPIVALSQLSRACESRTDKRPLLSDLRGSGSIEQDADLIMFVYRDEVYNKSPDNPKKGIAEVIVRKQRNGHTGTIEMSFLGKYTRFEDLARVRD